MLVVLAPTVCVLWFMSEAMKNERLAVAQKLAEAYQVQLSTLRADLEAHLTTKIRALEEYVDTRPPSAVFAVGPGQKIGTTPVKPGDDPASSVHDSSHVGEKNQPLRLQRMGQLPGHRITIYVKRRRPKVKPLATDL